MKLPLRCPVKTIYSGLPCDRGLHLTEQLPDGRVRGTYACGHVVTFTSPKEA